MELDAFSELAGGLDHPEVIIAVSALILLASLLLVLAAEITRRVTARKYGEQFAGRGFV